MSSLDKLFSIIETIRNINRFNERIVVESLAKYPEGVYREISNLYLALEKCQPENFELILLQVECEASNHKSLEKAISLLKNEITLFIEWYTKNEEIINNNFSYDAISDVVNDIAQKRFQYELTIADNDFRKAIIDEKIWHELARAYGSRAYGGKTYKDFDEDDRAYISGPLDAYKKHFSVYEVDLEKMYSDYPSVPQRMIEEAREKSGEKKRERDRYAKELFKQFVTDAYEVIYGSVCLISTSIGETHVPLSDVCTASECVIRPRGRRVYATYSSLEECIGSEEMMLKIEDWANQYLNRHQKIDTLFGKQLFDALKLYNKFSQGSCAIAHFGDLLINHFGGKCSFESGRSITSSQTIDVEFNKQLTSFFADN